MSRRKGVSGLKFQVSGLKSTATLDVRLVGVGTGRLWLSAPSEFSLRIDLRTRNETKLAPTQSVKKPSRNTPLTASTFSQVHPGRILSPAERCVSALIQNPMSIPSSMHSNAVPETRNSHTHHVKSREASRLTRPVGQIITMFGVFSTGYPGEHSR